jgi:hypothetical protein
VERVGRVAAVRARVGQRVDHVEELHERSRPAMHHEQRQRVWLGRADVQEMHPLAPDVGDELRVLVEPGLLSAPVVAGSPVLGEPP